MSPPRLTLFPLLLLLALATSASAQHAPGPRADPGASSPELDQIIYKGLVGNALDTIPMDPLMRVNLQRTNAVISSTASGRSLAVLAGLSNPVLLVAGLVWGVWSALNIKPEEIGVKLSADSGQIGGGGATQARLVALLAPSSAVDDTPAKSGAEPILASSNSAGNAGQAVLSRLPTIKIWLPERSSMLPQ